MSFDIQMSQPIATITEITINAENEIGETHERSFEFTEAPQGSLKTPEGNKTFLFKEQKSSTSHTEKMGKCFKESFPEKPVLKPAELHTTLSRQIPNETKHAKPEAKTTQEPSGTPKQLSTKAETKEISPLKAFDSSARTSETTKHQRPLQSRHSEGRTQLQAHKWAQKETLSWWESRYHEKEKEREGGGQRDQQQQQEQSKKEKTNLKCQKISASTQAARSSAVNGKSQTTKPLLPSPKLGIFALYYILTKMGIYSDGTSNSAYRQEIELLNDQTAETHKKRLQEMREAMKKEQSARRWGVAFKFFSWMGSLLGIITGAALIATGVGAVAGSMLIAAGVIQITNQLLELTGGWKKIAEKLPGESDEKKRAVITWIQIGIAVLSLVLTGVSIVLGGFSSLGEAMQTGMSLVAGIGQMGFGITSIGRGISEYMHKSKLSDAKRYDYRLEQLKHDRQDVMEKVDWGTNRLEQLFEDLARVLDFEVELFRADQMIYRRG